jgi:hypothetical protein
MTPAEKMRRWIESPLYFVRDQFGVEPDLWQVEALNEFNRNQRMAFKACKGPGKTALLSWFGWYFLATRSHPKIAATSITADNLNDNLWPEMAKWQAKSGFLKKAFHWGKTRIVSRDHPETWFMSARTWPRAADSSQQADTLAGLHADNLLFIIDEAGGIPDAVMAAAEAGLATGGDTNIIMAGNPTHRDGPLYRACTKERDIWWVKEITSDPDDPMRTPRVSADWARTQIKKYGRDNPWVLVNVFGKFPPSSINALLGPDEVSDAMGKHLPSDQYDFSQKRLGIDVARFGDDRTVIFPRQGLAAFKYVEMRGARSNEIAARVAQAKNRWGSEMEFIDGTGGYGSGVADSLIQAGHTPVEINFSSKATDTRYLNKRAEMWFLMAEWIKRGGALPQSDELAKELVAPTYTFKDGRFTLEKKDQIKERLGYSPDLADALALTFAFPEMTTEMMMKHKQPSRVMADYDPFADARL